MKWLQERLADRAQSNHRMEMIRGGAPLLFEELLKSCNRAVQDYSRLAPSVARTSYEVRLIKKTHDLFAFARIGHGQDQASASVNVHLDQEQATITVDHGDKPSLPTFLVQLEGTSFTLSHEGRSVGLEDACERILSPLMFPDLPQYFPLSSKT
jgi:hypothetical protein